VLAEVLLHQVRRLSAARKNRTSTVVVDDTRVKVPPPARLLEDGEQELGIVSSAYETLVVLELRPFEVNGDIVVLVQSLEKFDEHHLLAVADEGFRLQIQRLWNCDLQLLRE